MRFIPLIRWQFHYNSGFRTYFPGACDLSRSRKSLKCHDKPKWLLSLQNSPADKYSNTTHSSLHVNTSIKEVHIQNKKPYTNLRAAGIKRLYLLNGTSSNEWIPGTRDELCLIWNLIPKNHIRAQYKGYCFTPFTKIKLIVCMFHKTFIDFVLHIVNA